MSQPVRSESERAHLKDLAERLDAAAGPPTEELQRWASRLPELAGALKQAADEISAARATSALRLNVSSMPPLSDGDWRDLLTTPRNVFTLEVVRANARRRYELALRPAASVRGASRSAVLVLSVDLSSLQSPAAAVPVLATVTANGWDVTRATADALLVLMGRVGVAEPIPGLETGERSTPELATALWELAISDATARSPR